MSKIIRRCMIIVIKASSYKQYIEAYRPDGVCFSGFDVDSGFADCIDGFVIADTKKLLKKKRQR